MIKDGEEKEVHKRTDDVEEMMMMFRFFSLFAFLVFSSQVIKKMGGKRKLCQNIWKGDTLFSHETSRDRQL